MKAEEKRATVRDAGATEKAYHETKLKELETLCRPLNDWLQRNFNPYARIIVEHDSATLVRDDFGVKFDIYD